MDFIEYLYCLEKEAVIPYFRREVIFLYEIERNNYYNFRLAA